MQETRECCGKKWKVEDPLHFRGILSRERRVRIHDKMLIISHLLLLSWSSYRYEEKEAHSRFYPSDDGSSFCFLLAAASRPEAAAACDHGITLNPGKNILKGGQGGGKGNMRSSNTFVGVLQRSLFQDCISFLFFSWTPKDAILTPHDS